jgi:hypothetical protein
MLQVKRAIYFEHFQKHVKDLQKHLDERDYVQASEKVWGAISSFVNAFHSQEAIKVEEKKQGFALLLRKLITKDSSLDTILKKNFKSIDDLTTKAEGLHLYFYGSKKYPEDYLKNVIIGFADIFKWIYSKVVPEN